MFQTQEELTAHMRKRSEIGQTIINAITAIERGTNAVYAQYAETDLPGLINDYLRLLAEEK